MCVCVGGVGSGCVEVPMTEIRAAKQVHACGCSMVCCWLCLRVYTLVTLCVGRCGCVSDLVGCTGRHMSESNWLVLCYVSCADSRSCLYFVPSSFFVCLPHPPHPCLSLFSSHSCRSPLTLSHTPTSLFSFTPTVQPLGQARPTGLHPKRLPPHSFTLPFCTLSLFFSSCFHSL